MSILLALLVAETAFAQTTTRGKLTANIQRMPVVRSDAPINLLLKLDWTGTALLEGHLELSVLNGRQRLNRIRTDDLVLSTGERLLEITLPAVPSDRLVAQYGPGGTAQLTLRTVFVGQERNWALGEFPLRVPSAYGRRFSVCLCDPWGFAGSPQMNRLANSFRIEEFPPLQNSGGLTTSVTNLPPEQMPRNPLGYCSYNVVLLAEAGFTSLRDEQLEALLKWVRAGGSLCVVPPISLQEYQADFLNQLAASQQGDDLFLLDERGRLLSIPPGEEVQFRLAHNGMGRAAVVLTRASDTIDTRSADWAKMTAFLWNVRSDRIAGFVRAGGTGARRPGVPGDRVSGDQRFQYGPITSGNWLLERLRPKSVEVVPLGLLGLILVAYVLVIGPVDYFLLGALGLRKLTWIAFPVVTIGFAAFTVWLSHWYMQPSEERRSVQFFDIGSDGEVVRSSRFEMLFTGSPRDITSEIKTGLFSPLNHQRFRDADYASNPRGGFEQRLVGPPDYVGRLHERYAVTQSIPQWTPQVNRLFRITPDRKAPEFEWNGLAKTGQQIMQDVDRQRELRRRVREAFGSGAAAWVMCRGRSKQLAGDVTLFRRQQSTWYGGAPYQTQPVPVSVQAETAEAGPSDFLTQTCIRPATGLFSILSRIAPTGGDNFEDLAVLDPSDPSQWLLVVAVERGQDLFIYRKLYVNHGDTETRRTN